MEVPWKCPWNFNWMFAAQMLVPVWISTMSVSGLPAINNNMKTTPTTHTTQLNICI